MKCSTSANSAFNDREKNENYEERVAFQNTKKVSMMHDVIE